MKTIYALILVFLLAYTPTIAQVTDVVTNVNRLNSSIFINDQLYVAASLDHTIYQEDISVSPPVETAYITGITYPYDMLRYGNYLYVVGGSYYSSPAKLYKVDLTATNLVATEIFSTNSLYMMAEKDGYLYLANHLSSKIVKMDLSDDNGVLTDVITNVNGATGLAFKGDELYFTRNPGIISKINVTEVTPTVTDVVTGMNGNVCDLIFRGNELYFTMYAAGKLCKLNVTDLTQGVTTLLDSELLHPTGLTIYNNELYIADPMAHKLVKMALPLTTNSFDTNTITLYPNPATHVIQIKNLTTTAAYTISSVLGEHVATGTVTGEEPITVEGLANGLYFVTVGTSKAIRFVKQ